ncbi:MAG TPA: flagellar protein FlaG [Thermodesulfovibrio thiophilus]|nr:flagellar protein FlaG [Thermodesulfovibrio thiophilus]HQD37054.1 flagellar protein FlaG [Thermodesulfovibrio thiophilus]
MKMEGIEQEVVIINPYRQTRTDIVQNHPIQTASTQRMNNLEQNLTNNQNNAKKLTVDQEELNKMMDELRHKFSMLEKYLQINIDDQLQMPISKIIDMRTEEVIRQIPPEWVVEILRRMDELKGVLYSKEV